MEYRFEFDENFVDQVPELDETVAQVALFVVGEAAKKLEAGEDLVPFTALAVGENLFVETHPGDDFDQSALDAQHTVQGATGAAAYGFCYDGFYATDEDEFDAIIAEVGTPGTASASIIALPYEYDEETQAATASQTPVYLGEAPNFMALTFSEDEQDEDEPEEVDED